MQSLTFPKGLVSKMSQNKWFMNILDFNFGFNFLESLTFLDPIFSGVAHTRTITLTSHLKWPKVFSQSLTLRFPSGSLISHPFRCLFTAFFFFFFSTPQGLPNGARRTPLVVQALRACTPDPFGVRYKNPLRGFL